MTMEERVARREKRKKQAVGLGKVVTAISALTVALNGYTELKKQQNLMLEALSTQLSALTFKVSYIEGRMSGMTPHEAADRAGQLVPSPEPQPVPKPAEKVDATPAQELGEIRYKLAQPPPTPEQLARLETLKALVRSLPNQSGGAEDEALPDQALMADQVLSQAMPTNAADLEKVVQAQRALRQRVVPPEEVLPEPVREASLPSESVMP